MLENARRGECRIQGGIGFPDGLPKKGPGSFSQGMRQDLPLIRAQNRKESFKMALIHCPDCEREVSSRAVACPQCAYPIHALTSLPDAIRQNDIDMIRDLLKAGHKPDEKNGDGVHP